MAEEPKERKAFEAHMRVGGYSNHDKHPDGSYVSSAMELWWQGWKARAQLPSQECERLSNELNNMRISWGLMQSEREAALKQVERLTAMLHRASKAESRPEFTQIIAEALSAKP